MTNVKDETLLDLDSVADMDLGGINDLPEFCTPPDGLYVFCTNSAKITANKNKEGKEVKKINHTYHICKVIQVVTQDDLVPDLGNLVGENFTMNAQGLSIWKLKAKGILGQEIISTKGTIGDVLEEMNDSRHYFVGKTRIKKTNKEGVDYENVQVQVVRKAVEEDMEDCWAPAEAE
jgi:hypothetical protein